MNKEKILAKGKSVSVKIIRFVASRVFYLVLGVFLATATVALAASWPNAKVGAGTALTKPIWEGLVGYLEAMDTKVDNINSNINNKPGTWACNNYRVYNGSGIAIASCGAGERLISGGCEAAALQKLGDLIMNSPSGAGWQCADQVMRGVAAHAYCCK